MATDLLNRKQLIDYFMKSCHPNKATRFGVEYERICVDLATWEACSSKEVIAALTVLTASGWELHQSYGQDYKLTKSGASLSCEPGGQLEIALPPLSSGEEVEKFIQEIDKELFEVLKQKNWALLSLGTNPQQEDRGIKVIPTLRHQIMNRWLQKQGSVADYAMCGTASTQVSVDFISEKDLVNKFQLGLASLTSLMQLISSSPIIKNHVTAASSTHMFLWLYLDPARSSLVPEMLFKDASIATYVDYLLSVPMLFVYEPDKVVPAYGASFSDFMAGKLPHVQRAATLADWEIHSGTIFTPLRVLPGRLELRCIDSLPPTLVGSFVAFWNGLFSDQKILQQGLKLISHWQPYDFQYNLIAASQRHSITNNQPLQELALNLIKLAKKGLQQLGAGRDLTLLSHLERRAEQKKSLAEELVTLHQSLGGDTQRYMETVAKYPEQVFGLQE